MTEPKGLRKPLFDENPFALFRFAQILGSPAAGGFIDKVVRHSPSLVNPGGFDNSAKDDVRGFMRRPQLFNRLIHSNFATRSGGW